MTRDPDPLGHALPAQPEKAALDGRPRTAAVAAVAPPDGFEQRLQTVLAGVNDWLKFAEAKNGALIALDGAGLVALLGVAKDAVGGSVFPRSATVYFAYLGVCLVLALATAFTTLIPVLAVPWERFGRRLGGSDNLLYFGAAAECDANGYLAALADALGVGDRRFSRLERDYAGQIVTNARIAVRKYNAFSVAAGLTLFGLLTPAVGLLWIAAAISRRRR